MKHLFTFILIGLTAQLFAQGTIQSLSVSPENPTVNDVITVYAELQFSSGGCDVENQGHNVNGLTITANAHHCVGAATVICPVTDEFEIGLLPAGDYTFDFTLTSGFGNPTCSPGIVPDGTEQLQFTVSPNVGIDEVLLTPDFAYPNPVSDVLYFKNGLDEPAIITDIRGPNVLNVNAGITRIDLSNLSQGVYFLSTESKRLKFIKN
ncbi:MAG: T9SS type A sorting domain-containing protein [Flavobacteriales bacterium]